MSCLCDLYAMVLERTRKVILCGLRCAMGQSPSKVCLYITGSNVSRVTPLRHYITLIMRLRRRTSCRRHGSSNCFTLHEFRRHERLLVGNIAIISEIEERIYTPYHVRQASTDCLEPYATATHHNVSHEGINVSQHKTRSSENPATIHP